MKFNKGDSVVWNRENIDQENSYITEGTLLKDPTASGWFDYRDFYSQYESLQILEDNLALNATVCKEFVDKFEESNEILEVLIEENFEVVLKSPGVVCYSEHRNFFEYIFWLKDFLFYFSGVLGTDR